MARCAPTPRPACAWTTRCKTVNSLSRLSATAPRPGSLLVQCKHIVQCRTPRGAIVSMGLRGVQGGLRGEIEIFPGPPAKNVIKELPSLLFISTPQSIAKPSPGWNKVALLTAVRNSPCSCPFSVSLHPPLAALNSEPRPGRLFIANQKLSPRAGKVAWRSHDERGMTQSAQVFFLFPLSLTSFDSSPASGGAFWLHHSKLPLHFSASL